MASLSSLPYEILLLILEATAITAEPRAALIPLIQTSRSLHNIFKENETPLLRSSLQSLTGPAFSSAVKLSVDELQPEIPDFLQLGFYHPLPWDVSKHERIRRTLQNAHQTYHRVVKLARYISALYNCYPHPKPPKNQDSEAGITTVVDDLSEKAFLHATYLFAARGISACLSTPYSAVVPRFLAQAISPSCSVSLMLELRAEEGRYPDQVKLCSIASDLGNWLSFGGRGQWRVAGELMGVWGEDGMDWDYGGSGKRARKRTLRAYRAWWDERLDKRVEILRKLGEDGKAWDAEIGGYFEELQRRFTQLVRH